MTEEVPLIKCSRCRVNKPNLYFTLNSKDSLYKTCDGCRSYKNPKNKKPFNIDPLEIIEIAESVSYDPNDAVNDRIKDILTSPECRTEEEQEIIKYLSKSQIENFLQVLNRLDSMGGCAKVKNP